MKNLKKLKKLMKNERGQGLVEYALILVLIAIVVFAAVQGVGTTTNGVFTDIDKKLKNTGTTPTPGG